MKASFANETAIRFSHTLLGRNGCGTITNARYRSESVAGTVFLETAPIFRSFDEEKARAFYIDWLGFKVIFEHRFTPDAPLYMGLQRGDLMLHLSEHHGDATPGSTAFVRMKGIREFYDEINGRPYANNRPGLNRMPWGLQVEVIDPFSNRIRFCE
jgi:catechol 2,3-dioxygenase-like lactoylglutathione lyase family enzyme